MNIFLLTENIEVGSNGKSLQTVNLVSFVINCNSNSPFCKTSIRNHIYLISIVFKHT